MRARLVLALGLSLALAACSAGAGRSDGEPGHGADGVADGAPGRDLGLDGAGDAVPDGEGDAPVDAPGPDAGPAAFPAEVAAALEATLAASFPLVEAPGATLTVTLPGHAPWTGAAGLARKDPATPAQPGDRFRIGSLTKTFTAAQVLLLVADGALGLDDPVDEHLPGWDFGPAVTIRRLLRHETGIFDYTDDATFLGEARDPATPAEVVEFALAHGPVFAPGTDWRYSNTNYFLAGMILEARTGRPLASNLHARLTGPQGLADTFLDGFEPDPVAIVDGHGVGVEMTYLIDLSWAWASGGMASTGTDLCRWLTRLYGGAVLPDELLEELLAVRLIPEGADDAARPGDAYGLGVRRTTRAGLVVHGHTGSTIGFRGEAFVDLASGACVAVLTNDFTAKPLRLSEPAWEALRDALGP